MKNKRTKSLSSETNISSSLILGDASIVVSPFAHDPYGTVNTTLYPDGYDGPRFDWTDYTGVRETSEQVEHARMQNAALVTACDERLGKILDVMVEQHIWERRPCSSHARTTGICWTSMGVGQEPPACVQ